MCYIYPYSTDSFHLDWGQPQSAYDSEVTLIDRLVPPKTKHIPLDQSNREKIDLAIYSLDACMPMFIWFINGLMNIR